MNRARKSVIAGCAALLVGLGGVTGIAYASEQRPVHENVTESDEYSAPEYSAPEYSVPTDPPNGDREVRAKEPGDAPTLVKLP